MTDHQGAASTLTLVVAHQGSLAVPNVADFADGADEIIEVSTCRPMLQRHLALQTRYRNIVPRRGGAAHALNLGISFASSEWVILCFGDEMLASGWLNHVRAHLAEPDSSCIHLFQRGSSDQIPLVVVRRVAFAYGAFDERMPCDRLAALHWVFQIFPRPEHRILPDEGVSRHRCDWAKGARCLPLDAPLDGLLVQALDASTATLSVTALRRAAMGESSTSVTPYRSGAKYVAKQFWESNSAGYVRWEVYQPDEPEILVVVSRTSPRSVLELGCGAGRNTRYFCAASRYAGIDLSMNLLGRAAERQQLNSLGLVCGDITALPFSDLSFDMVFSNSTMQHVTPERINQCVADIVRVSSSYICLMEYTAEESEKGDWFRQIHMFAHDYRSLFAPHCKLLWRADTSLRVHPARKEVFLFKKRQRT